MLAHKPPRRTHWRSLSLGCLISASVGPASDSCFRTHLGTLPMWWRNAAWWCHAASSYHSTLPVPWCWGSYKTGLSTCSRRNVHWVSLLYHLPALLFSHCWFGLLLWWSSAWAHTFPKESHSIVPDFHISVFCYPLLHPLLRNQLFLSYKFKLQYVHFRKFYFHCRNQENQTGKWIMPSPTEDSLLLLYCDHFLMHSFYMTVHILKTKMLLLLPAIIICIFPCPQV